MILIYYFYCNFNDIIIIIIIVSFMHGIHTHILKTNNVPKGYIVAAILSLLFMVPLFLVIIIIISNCNSVVTRR
jgi:hypothetical protein